MKDADKTGSKVLFFVDVFKKSGEPIQDMIYLPTDFPNLFIRKQINQDKIIKINEILGDGFAISTISDHCYHQLLMSGDDSLLKNYDKHLFRSLPNSYFNYRCNSEDRLERINSILSTQIEYYNLSKEDKHLLDKFYNNNRNLILSILRLQLENELNMENCLEKEYNEKISFLQDQNILLLGMNMPIQDRLKMLISMFDIQYPNAVDLIRGDRESLEQARKNLFL